MAMRTRSELTVQYPDAAGIDVGGKRHCVAMPPGRSDTPVRECGGFTEDLHAMAAWLLACGVTVAALESTGVYRVPVFEVLESHGRAGERGQMNLYPLIHPSASGSGERFSTVSIQGGGWRPAGANREFLFLRLKIAATRGKAYPTELENRGQA